jgi:hypothetical protein
MTIAWTGLPSIALQGVDGVFQGVQAIIRLGHSIVFLLPGDVRGRFASFGKS